MLLPAEISGDRRDGSRKRALGLIEAMGLDGFQRRLRTSCPAGCSQRVGAACRSADAVPSGAADGQSRSPRSTRSPGTSCAPELQRTRTASIRPPSSSSPTPRSTRRSCWPIGWWCSTPRPDPYGPRHHAPRPRRRARAEQAEQLARRAAELHALLLDSDT
ncbi:hypothetical protein ACRAWF_15610 [Streptomyces sp. L7]